VMYLNVCDTSHDESQTIVQICLQSRKLRDNSEQSFATVYLLLSFDRLFVAKTEIGQKRWLNLCMDVWNFKDTFSSL
jgi:hypothetical protein